MRAGVGERFVVGGPLPIPLYRWGPAWGPWGSHGHHASAAGVVGRGRSSRFLVSSPLTCPPVYVGAPLNRWLEAVYDFPLVYHRTTSAAAAPGEAMVASASHSWSGGGGGAGVLVRGTPFALHSLPVPSSPAQHRAIRAELSSRLPCPSSVWLGGCPGPRGLALCAKGTVEGTVAGSEWVLKPGTAIPPSTGFVFSLPSGFSPVQEGSAVLSVEQLERLHHSDRPPPDLYAHLVPDGLTSAAEYSEAVDELRSSFRRADTGGARALMLQHDLADSVEAVVRALRATAGVLRSKGAREHAPAESEYGRAQQQQQQEEEGRRWWEIISGHMEEAHDAILQASLGAHWVQASWSPARRTRNQFLPLGRPSLLALQFTSQLLDHQLAEALDDGDYDLAAVLVREISFLKQSLLHSRAFVGLAAF